MIVFPRDLGTFEGESKFDSLACSVARSIGHEVKFAAPGITAELSVSQFGDGLVRYENGKKNVFIFHDWFDNYSKYLDKPYDKAIFLGHFKHPDVPKSLSIESYPVDPIRMAARDEEFPTVIVGEFESTMKFEFDWVIDRIKEFGSKAVRIACFCPSYRYDVDVEPSIKELIGRVHEVADKVCVYLRAPLCLLREYMGAAEHIVHLGGHRGMIHSLGVSTGKMVSFTGDDSFRPSRISELNARLLPYLR